MCIQYVPIYFIDSNNILLKIRYSSLIDIVFLFVNNLKFNGK